jgi:hypothetical protein
MNAENVAAWIIIGATASKLLVDWKSNQRRQVEKVAVTHEYTDVGTSETRKDLLLARYPQHIVQEPDLKFQASAWKAYRAEQAYEKSTRAGLKHFTWAVMLWTVACLAAFFLYVEYLKGHELLTLGTAIEVAGEQLISLLASRIVFSLAMAFSVLLFTAQLLKVMYGSDGIE